MILVTTIKWNVNNLLDRWKRYIFRGPDHRTNYEYHRKNNVDDKFENYAIPLERVTRKETLASRTLPNFMVQLKKAIPKPLNAIRKFRYEFQLYLNFNTYFICI